MGLNIEKKQSRETTTALYIRAAVVSRLNVILHNTPRLRVWLHASIASQLGISIISVRSVLGVPNCEAMEAYSPTRKRGVEYRKKTES